MKRPVAPCGLPVLPAALHGPATAAVAAAPRTSTKSCANHYYSTRVVAEYVTGSILWPTNPDVDPVAVDLSKQMALVMKQRSQEIDHVELTRYNGGSFAGIARNAYGLLGGGSALLEVVGQKVGKIRPLSPGGEG